jgi:hypothetical protein
LEVEAWWNQALDRNISGKIIKEAKVYTKLYSQKKKKKTKKSLQVTTK